MLNQGLHLALLNLVALQQSQATADFWSLATLFMLLLRSSSDAEASCSWPTSPGSLHRRVIRLCNAVSAIETASSSS